MKNDYLDPGHFDLIALDMDGTVLDDQKEIGAETAAAIHEALAAGKEVVFCTGRALAEMEEYLRDFPDMRYLLGESGALVYDLQLRKALYKAEIPVDDVKKICQAVKGRDIMPAVFSEGRYMVNRTQRDLLARYGMGAFAIKTPPVTTVTEDVLDDAVSGKITAEKLNLYHLTVEDRLVTRRILDELKPDVVYVDSEITSLECSPPGTSKASGLARLCGLCRITADRMIMVGDADNDLEGLKYAGFPIAMGNANEHVRSVCKAVVADNNHDGCAEAIRRYLLGKGSFRL